MTINQILTEICDPNSLYNEIIENIIYPNLHLKNELISEIAINWLQRGPKIEAIFQNGYLNYYFIMTVKNQIHSSTSSFHKNIRKSVTNSIDDEKNVLQIIFNDGCDDIQLATNNRINLDLLIEILNKIDISFFQREMFRAYHFEGKSYRKIEKEYGVDHVLVWQNVKIVMKKIRIELDIKNTSCV